MPDIPRWALTSGANIPCEGGCTIVQHKLKDILGIGDHSISYDIYTMYLGVLATNLSTLIEHLNIPKELIGKINVFDFLASADGLRDMVSDALSFFCLEDIGFDPARGIYNVVRGDEFVGTIDRESYESICNVILVTNNLKDSASTVQTPKFASKKAEEAYYKIQKGKLSMANSKSDPNLNLMNVIESVATYHPSLNLTNIFDLTIPQLYDQFARISGQVQMNILGTRWAAYGEKDFDFSVWYKDTHDIGK